MRRYVPIALVLVATVPLSQAGTTQGASNKAIWGTVRLTDGSWAFPASETSAFASFSCRSIGRPPPLNARPTRGTPLTPHITGLESSTRRWLEPRGMESALMAVGSPPWANGGRGPAWAPRNRTYANFLTAAARTGPSTIG
jgi:hypothetical protein